MYVQVSIPFTSDVHFQRLHTVAYIRYIRGSSSQSEVFKVAITVVLGRLAS